MTLSKAFLAFSLLFFCHLSMAGYFHGSLTSKVQLDNRQAFKTNSRQFGEVWGDFYYDDKANDLHSGLLMTGRLQDLNPQYHLYRAFIRKGISAINSEVTLGRFERSDNLGMYSIDGGNFRYSPLKNLSVDFYGGRPLRIEDIDSEDGESVFGTELISQIQTNLAHQAIPITLDQLNIRFGYQRFEFKNISHRLEFGSQLNGKIDAGCCANYQLTASGTYQIDQQRFQDLLIESLVNFNKEIRARARYQRYHPKANTLSFRERFFDFLTREKQQLIEVGLQHRPRYDITWNISGLRVTRANAFTGYGARAGIAVKHWPNVNLSAQLHYLDYGTDSTKSLYLGVSNTATNQLRLRLNMVLRDEQKQLSGSNRVAGAELETEYMIQNNLSVTASGMFIHNTKRSNEYLGAVKLTYYFDFFKAKESN
jgi:hypothetical protein